MTHKKRRDTLVRHNRKIITIFYFVVNNNCNYEGRKYNTVTEGAEQQNGMKGAAAAAATTPIDMLLYEQLYCQ